MSWLPALASAGNGPRARATAPRPALRPSELGHGPHEIRPQTGPLCRNCKTRPWNGGALLLCAVCAADYLDLFESPESGR